MDQGSTYGWVIRVPSTVAYGFGPLRLVPGLLVLANDDGSVWLRADAGGADLADALRTIGDGEWFVLRDDDQFTRVGETIPCGRLPQGDWVPLNQWFDINLPRAGFAGLINESSSLSLIRSTRSVPVNFLMSTWKCWFDFATTAPQVRLNQLGFAASDDDRVLIRGTPLPPIPGRRFSEKSGIIVPAGWRFEPDVGAPIVRERLNLNKLEMALFADDCSFERLSESAFVQATRSAVRLSNEA